MCCCFVVCVGGCWGVWGGGGGCNAMLNRELDFSHGTSIRSQTADTSFNSWIASLGLCNIWRTWNPQARQYTHTSAAHHTHSRIDNLFMPATDVHLTTGSCILPRGISDHSPVVLSLGGTVPSCRPMWCFNAWYLKDANLVGKLKMERTQYFQTNAHSESSPRHGCSGRRVRPR